MSVPLLLIDQDDTLGDLSGDVHDILQKDYGLEVPAFELRDFYNMTKTVPGLTHSVLQEVFHRPGLFANIAPNPGSVEALREMEQRGIHATICTKPIFTNYNCVAEKTAWVKEHYGSYWVNRMIFTEDKTVIMGRYLIDDKPVITGLNPVPMWDHVKFHQSYNAHVGGLRLMSWEDDWEQFIPEVDSPRIIIV